MEYSDPVARRTSSPGTAAGQTNPAGITVASPAAASTAGACDTSRFAVFASCPMCDGDMAPEHAHFRCVSCGWRDSCCD